MFLIDLKLTDVSKAASGSKLNDLNAIERVETITKNSTLAVRIKSGFKSYGKFEVLKNLDLNVQQGTM